MCPLLQSTSLQYHVGIKILPTFNHYYVNGRASHFRKFSRNYDNLRWKMLKCLRKIQLILRQMTKNEDNNTIFYEIWTQFSKIWYIFQTRWPISKNQDYLQRKMIKKESTDIYEKKSKIRSYERPNFNLTKIRCFITYRLTRVNTQSYMVAIITYISLYNKVRLAVESGISI